MKDNRSIARADDVPSVASPVTQPSAEVSARDAIAEANHRIANNLSMVAGMVRLYAREVANASAPLSKEKVGAILEEIGGRVEAIAHLHGLLASHDRGQPIDLSEYLREIAETVVSSFTFARKAELSYTSATACMIVPERALATGLIIGELVTNAVKYAHPSGVLGRITIDCSNTDGMIVLEVTDDGVGLPEGFDPMQDGGLGLRLVRSLANQLQAELAFDDTGLGLSVALRMASGTTAAG